MNIQEASGPPEVHVEDVAKTNVAGTDGEPGPQPVVTWTLDGFLNRLLQVNTTVERYGAGEIAELLANRIWPDPDIAIVRSALAHLHEVDREFTDRERAQ